MGSGLSKIKKQARLLEEQMAKMQEELQNKVVIGSAGGGLVKVTMSGEKELKKIEINPETLSDAEGLQDLIMGAFEEAYKQLQDESNPMMGFPNLPFGL